jgi:hypothetical protein
MNHYRMGDGDNEPKIRDDHYAARPLDERFICFVEIPLKDARTLQIKDLLKSISDRINGTIKYRNLKRSRIEIHRVYYKHNDKVRYNIYAIL